MTANGRVVAAETPDGPRLSTGSELVVQSPLASATGLTEFALMMTYHPVGC